MELELCRKVEILAHVLHGERWRDGMEAYYEKPKPLASIACSWLELYVQGSNICECSQSARLQT